MNTPIMGEQRKDRYEEANITDERQKENFFISNESECVNKIRQCQMAEYTKQSR